ncbi:MAG: protein-methionine-sulfoxide reductase heme-binding subunit MsrQ [Betaproteobacteria bacterium]
MNALLLHPAARPLAFLLCLSPFVYLFFLAATDALGANPQEALIRATGDWALRLMCLALAVTPLRQALTLPVLARWRRMVGLFAFFYASVHLLSYAVFDMGLELADILIDIAKRPFILLGTLTFLLLLPLAATSWNGAVRRLGAARWKKLHRLVYLASLTMLLHFLWMRAGKNNFAEVAVYAAVVAALLGWRVWQRRRLSQ